MTTKAAAYLLAPLFAALPLGFGAVSALPQATPEPAECNVAMPEADAILSALASPRAEASPIPAAVAEADLPAGQPADEAATAGATATVRQLFGCINAGEAVRIYGLFSDRYLRTQVLPQQPSAEELGALESGLATAIAASPVARPEAGRFAVVEVRDVRVLPDGGVGAVVTVVNPSATPRQDSAFFVLTREGDRYLIDSIIDIVEPSGTPAP